MSQILHRVAGVLNLQHISNKKILIVGLGSLGSMTVDNLAYPWRQLVLVDRDSLSEANVERHVLGKSNLGLNKARAMAQYLVAERGMYERNLAVYAGGVQDILGGHTDADLVIVSVDNRQARDDVNIWCIQHDIPALYGGVFPGGTGGEICVVPSPKDACYVCAQQVIGGNKYEGKGPNVDYGVNPDSLRDERGDPTGVSALRGIISQVAAGMAGYAIDVLTKKGAFEPHIHIIAAGNGEDILTFPANGIPKEITECMLAMRKLGLVPPFALAKREKGYSLTISRSALGLQVRRWDRCPHHQTILSPEF